MASEAPADADPQISFKVKTSSEGNHNITMSESATVLDLKNKLAGDEYEKVPAERQRLIYSGRVMKNEEPLSTYKIKAGNTVHMVKSAASNVAQNPATAAGSAESAPRAAAGVPVNMAAGTSASNPLAGLTGARYAGRMNLPGLEMFGADGGMGAPPSDEAMAQILEDPNMQQTINEALNNPQMIDMMIEASPGLRNNPHARQMLQSPEFRRMMTNPNNIRQAARLRRMMQPGGAAGGFPAPGVTDTTPAGAAGSTPGAGADVGGFEGMPLNPFLAFGGQPGQNPFAALFAEPGTGQTPAQTPPAPGSAGQGTPSATNPSNPANPPANPFAPFFAPTAPNATGSPPNAANPFAIPGMPPITPEMMQQAMAMMQNGGFENLFGPGGAGAGFGMGGTGSPPPVAQPVDTRPPEERYADQLRQLNDMGFFDFDRNVEALRRSGGSVQGAIEQLLR